MLKSKLQTRRLVVINFFPTSKLFGAKLRLATFKKAGFQVQFWDASYLNYSSANIEGYYKGGLRKFDWEDYMSFDNVDTLKDEVSRLQRADVVWVLSRFLKYFDDDWLFADLKRMGVKVYLQHFDTEVVHYGLMPALTSYLRSVKHRFLSNDLKISGVVGSGVSGRRQVKSVFPTAKFISVPSVKVLWAPAPRLFKGSYCIFVEEALGDAPDAALLESKPCNDLVGYSNRVNGLLDKYESYYNIPVIIAASGKTKYARDAFGGRTIIYGATLQLIQNASFVIGHMSLALDQCVSSEVPLLIVDDESFSKKRRREFGFSIISHLSKPTMMSAVDKCVFEKAHDFNVLDFRKITEQYLKEPLADADYENVLTKTFLSSS